MNFLLLFLSVFAETVKNAYTNHFSKRIAQTNADTYLFNAVLSVGAVVFFLFSGNVLHMSTFSFVVAFVFAVVTIFAQVFLTMAMGCGPMSFSILFTYLGTMIIPTVYGMFLGQHPSVIKWIGFGFMLVSVALSVDLKQKGEHSMSAKWLLLTVGGFIMWGLVGVCQQIHQSSVDHADEINGFLFWSFIMMTVLLMLFFYVSKKRGSAHNYRVKSKPTIFVLLSGVGNGAINLINLFLAGVMPGIIFFPIVSGGVIILSGIAAIIVFKEWMDKKQAVGVAAGIISVLLLSI